MKTSVDAPMRKRVGENVEGECTCLSFLSHSARMSPPSLQAATSGTSETFSSSFSSDASLFRMHPRPRFFLDCDAHVPSGSSLLIFACEHNGGFTSFSIRDSMTEAVTRFGTNGKVSNNLGVVSGVMINRLRQMGQSTDSCHPPHGRCNREKNHLRMHRAQNV